MTPLVRAVPSQRRLSADRKSGFRQMLFDFWLAALPLIAALISVVLQAHNDTTLRLLTVVLFSASLSLLLKHAMPSIQSRRWGKLMIMLGFVGWYSLPGLLNLWTTSRGFSDELPIFIHEETLLLTILYLALFLFVWVLASRLFGRQSRNSPEQQPVSSSNPAALVTIALLACSIGFLPYVLSGMSFRDIVGSILESRAVDKPWTYTENLGNRISALLYLTRSAMTAGAGLLLVVLQDKRVKIGLRIAGAFVASIVTVLLFFDQGTRSLTAMMLLPAIVLLFTRAWTRSKFYATTVLLTLTIVLFFALQFQLLFRYSYTRYEAADLLLDNWATLSGTTDYFSETALAVAIVPSYHDYFRESALLQFAVSPIPRFLWENKPATEVAWFYTLMRWGIDIYTESGNTFPGIVGQYYMSWGWLGPIIIGVILAFISVRCDRFLSRVSYAEDPYQFAVGAMLAVWLLVTYRYLSPGFLYPVLFAAGIVALSKRLPQRKQQWMKKLVQTSLSQN